MPWLPSFAENDHDHWRRQAETRISFLKRFSERSAKLLSGTYGSMGPDLSSRLMAAEALTEAAELAFATDQSDFGVDLLKLAVSYLLDGGPASWPTVRIAVLGALTGQVSTTFLGEIVLKSNLRGETTTISYSAPAVLFHQTAGSLLAAALASGSTPNLSAPLDILLTLIAETTSQAKMLPLFNNHHTVEANASAVAAYVALHQSYEERLRLLAIDVAHWSSKS